jgi:hypothetical protein
MSAPRRSRDRAARPILLSRASPPDLVSIGPRARGRPIVSRGTKAPRLSPLRDRPPTQNDHYWRSNKLEHANSCHDLKIPVNKIWK